MLHAHGVTFTSLVHAGNIKSGCESCIKRSYRRICSPGRRSFAISAAASLFIPYHINIHMRRLWSGTSEITWIWSGIAFQRREDWRGKVLNPFRRVKRVCLINYEESLRLCVTAHRKPALIMQEWALRIGGARRGRRDASLLFAQRLAERDGAVLEVRMWLDDCGCQSWDAGLHSFTCDL